MSKQIFYVLFLFSAFAFSQHTINGTLKTSEKYPWMLIYKLNGSKQDFVTYDSIKQGAFNLTMSKNREKGMYRLVYDMQNQGYLDIFYDDEDVELSFVPGDAKNTVKFSKSKNNILYQHYVKTITPVKNRLDSLQLAYFKELDKNSIEHAYKQQLQLLDAIQKQFEKDATGLFVYDFIKSNRSYYGETLYHNPEAYAEGVTTHFYDAIDFSNTKLLNTTFIHDKINEFIFKLNTSEDAETQRKLRKKAINTTLEKLKANPKLSQDIQEGLLYNFAQIQDIKMTNHMLNHYLTLPKENQDVGFINDIKGQLRTAIGNIAPNILWEESGVQKSLLKMHGSTNYLVVFWSSTCGHCLKELPLLKAYLKDKPMIKVLAVGLETEQSKAGWKAEIAKYTSWTHVYGKDKWKNKYAVAYGVNSTPSFYFLDAKKIILDKPDNVKELKALLEK